MLSNARDDVSLIRIYSVKCLFKNCSSSLQQRETLSKIFPNSQYTLALVIVNGHFNLTSVFFFFLRSQLLLNYSNVGREIIVIDPEIRNFPRFMVNPQYESVWS